MTRPEPAAERVPPQETPHRPETPQKTPHRAETSGRAETPERAAALVARAEAAVLLSGTDPRVALAEARAVLAETAGGPCPEALSVALRASALATRELGDLTLAEERLQQAIAAGEGLPRRVAQARMSLVTVRAQLGDPEGGLRLADLAERDLTGSDLARLGVQRSVALILLGRHGEAVRHCDDAIESLDGDPKFQAGGLLNRGLAHTFLEEYGAAEADLSACASLARRAGLDHVAMLAEGNLPFVAARRGDIPASFERYHAAESALSGYPERLAAMRTDYAEALLAARLPGEARAVVERAVPDLEAAGAHAALPEARLLLARAELLTGDGHRAAATAGTALAELAGQGRSSWASLAEEVLLRARVLQEEPGHDLLADLLTCAGRLAVSGWTGDSHALRLTAAGLACRLGDLGTAREQLALLAGSPAKTVIRQHAAAMLLHLDGDRSGALEAAAAGLAAVASQADSGTAGVTTAGTGASGVGTAGAGAPGGHDTAEHTTRQQAAGVQTAGVHAARVHAARPAEDLAAFGLRTALGGGDPWTVLTWAERWRAIVRGTPPPAAFTRPPVADGTLVELVRDEDDLWGIAVGSRGCALHSLGSYTAAVEATVRIRYCLRRRNLRDAEAAGGLDHELESLGRRLLGPVDLGGGPVLVVPTGSLCTLPWPLLPCLRGRAVSVAAEGASWLAADRPSGPREPYGVPVVVALAGPGLAHAGPEAEMVVRTHPGAERAAGTRAGMLAALERADVLHVAAHGMFSPRSPMSSRITLEDGPLMAYELRRLRAVPRLVVLSACDAGMAHAPVDGAVLGLAGAFLDRGAACVVAGVAPVRDDEASALMTVFHAFLADGRAPAEALGAAAAKTGVGGFVCFGAGDERVDGTPERPDRG
ncbi:CHAT domain-containing protein [Planotetraspora phitsanulokensis]|uniref:CHAT domain-containing protein n=1 Tax=Planotetraspora phitsanulokensis TaxID=575192 RepID=A0A8J3U924_9ACTN|nr:CHAT domain-containing protein [Planotetraspora phitsanulokensis]